MSRHTKKETDKYKDTFYYRCLHRGKVENGSKCDFKVNLNQESFNKEIDTVILMLTKNEGLRQYIEKKMDEKVDVSRLEQELEQTKETLE